MPVRLRDSAHGATRRAVRGSAGAGDAGCSLAAGARALRRHGPNPRAESLPVHRRPRAFHAVQGSGRNMVGCVRRRRRVHRCPEGVVDDAGADHRRSLPCESPRSGRRRLSDRKEVVLHSQGHSEAQVSRGQCRRGRAGNVQGPIHPRAGPACAARGHGDCRLCHREPQGLCLRSW